MKTDENARIFPPADGIMILTYIFGRRRSLEVHHPHNDVPYFFIHLYHYPHLHSGHPQDL
jgi:hypothetical protein